MMGAKVAFGYIVDESRGDRGEPHHRYEKVFSHLPARPSIPSDRLSINLPLKTLLNFLYPGFQLILRQLCLAHSFDLPITGP